MKNVDWFLLGTIVLALGVFLYASINGTRDDMIFTAIFGVLWIIIGAVTKWSVTE